MNIIKNTAKKAMTLLFLIIIVLTSVRFSIVTASENTKPNEPGPWPSVQVNTYTGNLFHQRNDLIIPTRGEIQLDIYFSYNSLKHQHDKGYGNGWSFSFGMYYKPVGNDIVIFREDGQEDVFTWDESVLSYNPPVGVYDELTEYSAGKFLLKTKYGIKYYFDDNSHKHLTSIVDRNNNTITLSYSGGRPTTITDPSGRMLNLAWVGDHLTQITDPNTSPSRVIAFQYDDSWNLIQVTRPLGNAWLYSYNVNGNMIALTDPRANTVTVSYDVNEAVAALNCAPVSYSKTFTYDNCNNTTTVGQVVSGNPRLTVYSYNLSGRVTGIHHPDGASVSFAWDSQNNLLNYINEMGSTTTYTYDSKGNLLSKTDCLGNIEFYNYESIFNKIVSYHDKNGNPTSFSYDSRGNPILKKDCLNNTEVYTYDSFGNLMSLMDKNLKTTTYIYDAYGNQISLTDPLAFSETKTYDQVGNVLTFVDKRGFTTTYTFDLLDHNTLITDAMGYTKSFIYDANGNLVSETNQNNQNTNYSYDALNRLTSTTDAMGGILSRTYDEANNIISETNALGNITLYTYNSRNRLISITDCMNNSASYTYNDAGYKLTSHDKSGNMTTYSYDCLGQLISMTDPNGSAESFNFDAAGNQISHTNKNGIVTTYAFDCLNRLAVINFPMGYSESITYDAENNQTGITDKNGFTTTFAYDALGRILTVTDPLGKTESSTYNGTGQAASSTDKNGNTTTYSYDPLGRLIQKTDPAPYGHTESYSYDGIGNILTSQDRRGNITTYQYDGLNRQISMTTPMGYTETTSYDAMGNIMARTNKNGYTTTYTYDCLDRKILTTDPVGNNESFGYNADGKLTSLTDKNGGITTWNYSCCRLLSNTDQTLQTESYGYDNEGNRTLLINKNGHPTGYLYDNLNRLIKTTSPMGHLNQYILDGNGNITSKSDENLNTIIYTYNDRNELINELYPNGSTVTYSYDNKGSLMQSVNTGGAAETVTYTYDIYGRILTKTTNYGAFSKTITHVRDQNGNNLSITSETGMISYLYDTDNRITQITDQNGGTTTFQYDGMGNQTVANYPNGVSTYTSYDANGNVISVVTQTTPPTPPPAVNPGKDKKPGNADNEREILYVIDYAVVGISSPISGPGLGENELVSITVMNQGMVILPEFMVSFVLDDSIAFMEMVTFPIAPMESYDHVFSQTVDLSIPGEDYFLTVCVNALGDENPLNDCMNTVIFNEPMITVFQSFNYAYDDNGNKTWEEHIDGSYINCEFSPRNELLSEFNSATLTLTEYTYLPGGQRETMTVNESVSYLYQYNPDGVLISAGGTIYTADNMGNRTSMTDPDGFVTYYSYGYNYELLLTERPDGGYSQYWYSAQGELLKESHDGIITCNHYLEKELLTEMDGSGDPIYVHNPRLSLNGDSGTGYLFYDGLDNSTLELGPDQTILATAGFDHYGNTTGLTGAFINDLMVFNSLGSVPEMSAFTLSRNDLPSPWLYDPQSGFSYNFNINGPEMGPETPGIPYGPDGSDPTPRPKGIPNPDPPTEVQTCCCCVRDLNIKSITALPPPQFGHLMETEIKLEYKVWTRPESQDCTLEWWEKSNVPPDWQGVAPNTWNDMYQNASTRPSFNHSWGCRNKPCPPPYTITIIDKDPPSLAVRPGRTVTRMLEFAIKVRSAPDCPCSFISIAVFARQQLTMVNGVPQRDEASSYLERGGTSWPPNF